MNPILKSGYLTKPILSLMVFLTLFTGTYAQTGEGDAGQKRLGITYASFGKNDVMRADDLIGGPSYSGDNFYTIGIRYLHPVYSDWLAIETGLEYSHHVFTLTPAPTGMPSRTRSVSNSLINIPIGARGRFLQFLFANAGFLIDIDAGKSSSVDSQNGIGVYAGLGIEYDFLPGFSLFVNPYSRIHALLPFALEKNRQRITENGVQVGLLIGW